MFERRQDDDVTDVESAFSSLTPAPSRIDRDALMFRAGQLSAVGRRGLRLGSTVWAALLAGVVGAGLVFLVRPGPRERVVRVAVDRPVLRVVELSPVAPFAKRPGRSTRSSDYLELRDRVLAEGVDALSALRPAGDASPGGSLDDLWRELGIRSPHRAIPWSPPFSERSPTS